MWKHVSCPYVLELEGVFYHNDFPAIVTPWMPNGNITEYLRGRPDADRLHLVSLNIPPAPAVTSYPVTVSFCAWPKESSISTVATSRTGISEP